jgi:hypothetical protein
MYEKLSTLPIEKIQTLEEISLTVPMSEHRKRVGAGGVSRMSVYTHSKWTTWNRHQKSSFKSVFDSTFLDKAVIGWILHFPANTGFLDLMTAWVDDKICGTIVAYALADQKIELNGEVVEVARGEGIKFGLQIPHEIKSSQTDQKWACLMLME